MRISIKAAFVGKFNIVRLLGATCWNCRTEQLGRCDLSLWTKGVATTCPGGFTS